MATILQNSSQQQFNVLPTGFSLGAGTVSTASMGVTGGTLSFNAVNPGATFTFPSTGGTVALISNISQMLVLSATSTGIGGTGLTAITGLTFSLNAGSTYSFFYMLGYRGTSATTGLRLGITGPSADYLLAKVEIVQAVSGPTSTFFGEIRAIGGSVTAGSTPAINTTSSAIVTGYILPTASGSFGLMFAGEIAGGTMTISPGSIGTIQTM